MTDHEAEIDVVLVTGLSGAGRGTAAKVLEDLGWYVADNLPPELIARMVDLGLAAGSRITQLAVVMDVRSRGFTGDLDLVRDDLATRKITPRVLFLDASDDILVRRYENNRRSHPLQGNQTGLPPISSSTPRRCRCRRCGSPSSGPSAGRALRARASPWNHSDSNTGCRWTPTW
jgi:RNase adaptor protein for sRNA GlmZ degradation